jgi:pyruvate formate lyase activating enzyme
MAWFNGNAKAPPWTVLTRWPALWRVVAARGQPMTTEPVAAAAGEPKRYEARFYCRAAWDAVHCNLCPHQCAIAPSRAGNCGVRYNRDGKLYTELYNRVGHLQVVRSSLLPLFHLHPSKPWLQVGMKGCNMRCTFCDTFRWSQLGAARAMPLTVDQLIGRALSTSCIGISFGVTEPAVGHEFVSDVFKGARNVGLRTHLATNGEWTEEPFQEILPLVDAITFGIKGFDADWMMQVCGGLLQVVVANVATAMAMDTHVEVAYLLADSRATWREELTAYCNWLDSLERYVPTTLIRMVPSFMWKGAPTRQQSMSEALHYLQSRLPFVYNLGMGDMPGDTRCTSCGRVMIRRIEDTTIVDTECAEGVCPSCGADLPFVV